MNEGTVNAVRNEVLAAVEPELRDLGVTQAAVEDFARRLCGLEEYNPGMTQRLADMLKSGAALNRAVALGE